MKKREQHNYIAQKMREIYIQVRLETTSTKNKVKEKKELERVVVKGNRFTAILNDCVDETANMEADSVDLIHTSIPFGNHYEYSANYNDFGHNEDTARFFEQMDFLSPNLLKILKPGRVFACHVKDRVLFGNATGT